MAVLCERKISDSNPRQEHVLNSTPERTLLSIKDSAWFIIIRTHVHEPQELTHYILFLKNKSKETKSFHFSFSCIYTQEYTKLFDKTFLKYISNCNLETVKKISLYFLVKCYYSWNQNTLNPMTSPESQEHIN